MVPVVKASALTSGGWGKQKLTPPGIGLNAHPRTEPAGLGPDGSRVSAFRPRAFFLPPGLLSPTAATAPRVLGSSSPTPCTPPQPSAARPAPPAGTWSARAGAGTHAAHPPRPPTRAFPKFLRAEPGPGWGRGAQEPAGATPPRGEQDGGMLSQPHLVPLNKASYREKPRI